ncbi:hypothetical protein DPMN_116799 [Dreissena polymorpha]|uniref:Uncharacterized protein n=1 Tax=Dreissena polymorpha TaxID=45954 RepID=A0A9D4QTQ5_DREPO|nr:hypothetical protein DPMN_116799 [Dreissena polymorpha]
MERPVEDATRDACLRFRQSLYMKTPATTAAATIPTAKRATATMKPVPYSSGFSVTGALARAGSTEE